MTLIPKKFLFTVACAVALNAAPLAAQTVLSGNHSVDGGLCVGLNCTNSEVLGATTTMRLKQNFVAIVVEDTSVPAAAASTDWSIEFNSGGLGRMVIEDRGDDGTSTTDVFVIEGAGQPNAMYLASGGNLGLGTALPSAGLHVVEQTNPAIRLEEAFGSTYSWEVGANRNSFFVQDITGGGFPFQIEDGAPSGAFNIEENGDIGFGIVTPEGKLHTRGDGTQLVYFESGDGGAVQMRFRSDSQNRRFLAVNNSNQVQTQMQFRDNEILFLGATAADEWLRVDASGITTMGGTCNVNPCDRTFDTEYFKVPPIEERAAYMWENMHLPAVGPTKAGEPINLTEKTTGMLHELEVAHIYIEQLNTKLTSQKDQHSAAITDLRALVAQQQAQITALQGAVMASPPSHKAVAQ